MIEHTICVTSHKLPDERFIYHYVVTIGNRILVAGNATNYRNAWLWALTALNGHVGNLGL
jgi:hypothetical protein